MISIIKSLINGNLSVCLALMVAGIIVGFSPGVDADDYLITDLGTLGGNWSRASRMNSMGQVVGMSSDSDNMQHGFFWDGYELNDLGTPDDCIVSGALAINDYEQIVGFANIDYENQDAYFWEDSIWTYLHPDVYSHNGLATDINNYGHIVGYHFILGQNGRSEAWLLIDSITTELGSLGGSKTYASALNIDDQIVGWSQIENEEEFIRHAFYWDDSVMTDLGVLPNETNSVAYDINDSGLVCGESSHKQDVSPYLTVNRPCMWENTEITDLGLLEGFVKGSALGINNLGQIVGWLSTSVSGGADAAFVYQNGEMIDLNTLIPENSDWVLETATDINDNGQIAGIGIDSNNEVHAFLLTPTQTGVENYESNIVPSGYSLMSNYPNPFNNRTTIQYTLPIETKITVKVYDILGREVEVLISGYQSAGNHQVIWDAAEQSSGVYFISLQTADFNQSRMMTLVK